jgi:hypothetical protein
MHWTSTVQSKKSSSNKLYRYFLCPDPEMFRRSSAAKLKRVDGYYWHSKVEYNSELIPEQYFKMFYNRKMRHCCTFDVDCCCHNARYFRLNTFPFWTSRGKTCKCIFPFVILACLFNLGDAFCQDRLLLMTAISAQAEQKSASIWEWRFRVTYISLESNILRLSWHSGWHNCIRCLRKMKRRTEGNDCRTRINFGRRRSAPPQKIDRNFVRSS